MSSSIFSTSAMYSSCATRLVLSFRPSFTFVLPPRSSPNISRPRPNHLAIAFWSAGMVMSASGFTAASAQRRLVLLDRAELRRGLRPDDREELLRGLRVELLRNDGLRLPLAVTDLDLVGHVLLDPRAQAERLVLREIGIPLLRKLRVV